MYFDIFLVSVIVVTAYLGPMVLRHQPPGHRLYGWLLLVDGGAALLALLGRHTGPDATADLIGFVAISAAVCLVMVPPILRDLARRALMADRLSLAHRLMELRELIQPGLGARREREFVKTLIAVRAGQVDEAVAALQQALQSMDDPTAVRRIRERIVLTYLSARRWQEAIDAYESGLDEHILSPQLVVEMVRAYCEVRDLESAATLVAYVESWPASEEPLFSVLVSRARLVFLAFAGQVQAVDTIVGVSGPLGMLPPATRHFWSGIARLNAGDLSGARLALQKAARLARRDRYARGVAQGIIDSIDAPGVAGPRELPANVGEFAHRLAAEATDTPGEPAAPVKAMPPMSSVSWRRIPVTTTLILVNLLVFTLVLAVYGSTGDPGGLVRAGANVKSAVKAGEWWRLASSMFLHVGMVHVLINMYALWILGKLVEQLYGPVRTFALYMSAGLVGALASALFGGPGISVGASGAVLGLLGALIAELGLNRDAYPGRWRKVLFGNLVFVAAAQVAIGFFYPAIDQSAHVGGLVSGAVAALWLSPRSLRSRAAWSRAAVVGLSLVGAFMALYAVFGVATTDYGKTLARYGESEYRVGSDLIFTGPAHWSVVGTGRFRDVEVIELSLEVDRSGHLDVAHYLARRLEDEKPDGGGARELPAAARLALPAPWQSHELGYIHRGIGGEQSYRIIVFGRAHGAEVWLGSLLVPEALAHDIQPMLARMLSSMRPL